VQFETVIGLEIHAQLKTNTKIFCSCSHTFGAEPNSHGCPVCLGLPGALPVMNAAAARMAVRTGLALGCSITETSIFARKNYFYPDLPKGYQISQYELPICENGELKIDVDEHQHTIGITRIHLEEDAGKLIHDQGRDSLFDVNRCGTPLIEIVTEPDIRSAQQAYAFLTELKLILQYLDVCNCNMEEGSLRCDANISIRPHGQSKLGTKTELKNMNSFRGVEKAITMEVLRQREVLSSGGTIIQQTFLWDANKNQTIPMRSKEDAHDYRYFPDPDLPPLIVTDELLKQCREQIPELPAAKRQRFKKEFKLSDEVLFTLTGDMQLSNYFEATAKLCGDGTQSGNWICSEILKIINEQGISLDQLHISPQVLSEVITLVQNGTISAASGKKLLTIIHGGGGSPQELIKQHGLEQVSDTSALQSAVDAALAANPAEFERLKNGEKKLIGFFVGQVMKAMRGKGDPKQINKLLQKAAS